MLLFSKSKAVLCFGGSKHFAHLKGYIISKCFLAEKDKQVCLMVEATNYFAQNVELVNLFKVLLYQSCVFSERAFRKYLGLKVIFFYRIITQRFINRMNNFIWNWWQWEWFWIRFTKKIICSKLYTNKWYSMFTETSVQKYWYIDDSKHESILLL